MTPEQQKAIALAKARQRKAEFEAKPIGRPEHVLTEPLKAIGGAILGDIAGGAVGGVQSMRRGLTPGQEAREAVSGRITDVVGQPQTRIGTIGLEAIGDVGQAISRGMRAPMAWLAGKGEEYLGEPEMAEETAEMVRQEGFLPAISNRLLDVGAISPEAAGVIQMTPEIAGTVAGGAYAVKRGMGRSAQIADQLKRKQQQAKGKELTVYKEGQPDELTDVELGQYKLTSTGRAVPDETVGPLVKKGFNPGVLAEYKASTNKTKAAMLRMVDIKRRGIQYPRFGRDNRPADVVGQALMPRINHLRAVNRRSGKAVNQAANGLRGKTVDFNQPFDDFLGNLDEMGINLQSALNDPAFFSGTKTEVMKRIKGLYEGSDLDLMPGFQRPLTNVIYRAGRGQNPDAYDLHKLKRFIDENVTYGKAEAGLSARVARTLKGLRSDIDSVLDNNFPDYKKANDIYSETITVLDNFQDVMPRRIDLDMKNLDKALGQELRKLESNYNVRTTLINALDDLEATSRKYGKVYDDDIGTLTTFMTDLDEIFGPTGRNTFESRIGRAVDQAVSDKSKTQRVREFVQEKLSPDDEEAFEMLRRMIRQSEWQ